MNWRRALRALAACGVLLLWWAPLGQPEAAADEGGEIRVIVAVRGDVVVIDADVDFPAPRPLVWTVLTDFERLPEFISNLKTSRIVLREGNRVQVEQGGVGHFGPVAFPFRSLREFTLHPYEGFETRQIAGNLKHFAATTRLSEQGGGTHVHLHAEAVPDTLLPLELGKAYIAAETREHFGEMRAEVRRRQAAA